MRKIEYISILQKELSKLPPDEIASATEYFEEIFEEATEGLDEEARWQEEERLTAEFGNPKKVAAQIKADYAARILGDDTENLPVPASPRKKVSAVWWILLGILAAPAAIPIAIILIALLILICAAVVAGAGLGISLIGLGILGLEGVFAVRLMAVGIGLMVLAFSAAVGAGFFLLFKAIVKAAARKISESNERRKARKQEDEWAAPADVPADGERSDL